MDANQFLENLLVEQGLTTQEKIDSLRELVTQEKPLSEVLLDQGVVAEDTVLNILEEYFGLTSVNLHYYIPENEVIELMPLTLCEKYLVFPLFRIKNTLVVATANPSDIHAMDEIRVKTGFGVEPVLAMRNSIEEAINRYYSVEESVSDMIDTIDAEETQGVNLSDEQELMEAASDEPIVKLVNLFIAQALRDRASDIHINPDKDKLRVRNRIDGFLYEVAQPPKKFQAAVISRIKILASLDIAERRRPQDGRIELKIDNRVVDLRVSTFPTIYGENIVMRVLDKGSVLIGLEELGFSHSDLNLFNKLIKKPYGIILTSGPTGSGKTTTLYAALQSINSMDKNIITLEDPVEYDLQLIRQSQINTKTGFTFASGLRAILRQDPDVILVGEIRDEETANIAVQAAMTGHLVFSTLHTNDAVGCVMRLSELGIKPFLIGSTLIGALAQRLVRLICSSCKEEYTPSDDVIKELEVENDPDMKFYRGRGCQDCRGSGYRGRIGLYEIMEMNHDLQHAVLSRAKETDLRELAYRKGMRQLRYDGVEKVKMGLTTTDEVIRVTRLF